MSFIGLPEGNDFAVTRVRQSLRPTKVGREGVICTLCLLLRVRPARQEFTPGPKRQLEPPMVLQMPEESEAEGEISSWLVVEELMKGRSTNWSRARRAAKRTAANMSTPRLRPIGLHYI
eukprot:g30115.t1